MKPATTDLEAYQLYLKGRFFLRKMTEEGFRKGIKYFEQAIEKAPEFAPAYSGMATCYCLLGGHGFEIVKPSEGMPAAKKAVLEALRLDDSLAEPHAFLAASYMAEHMLAWSFDPSLVPRAEEHARRCIELAAGSLDKDKDFDWRKPEKNDVSA